jgi:hypothetical protein
MLCSPAFPEPVSSVFGVTFCGRRRRSYLLPESHAAPQSVLRATGLIIGNAWFSHQAASSPSIPSRFESRSLTVGCHCQWDRQRRGSEGDRGRLVVSRRDRNSEHLADMMVAFRGFPMPRDFGMAEPSTDHVRSRDAATTCRVRIAAWKARRGSPKVARNGTFSVKFQRLYTNVLGGWKPRYVSSSFGISHRTVIGSLGEQRQGVPRSAIDKRPAPPHGVVFSFHFPMLVCAIFPTFVRVRSRVGRKSQPFMTAASSVLVRASGGSRPYGRCHALGESDGSLHKSIERGPGTVPARRDSLRGWSAVFLTPQFRA